MHERLTGMSMSHAFGELAQQRVQEGWTKLNPSGHFILILKSLFTVCLDRRLSNSLRLPHAPGQIQTTSPEGDQTNANMEVVDNMLCIISISRLISPARVYHFLPCKQKSSVMAIAWLLCVSLSMCVIRKTESDDKVVHW